MKRSLFVACSIAAIMGSMVLSGQAPSPAPNPLIGTWKQNLEKSTYSPGPPPPQGLGSVRQYAAGVDGSIVAITFNLDSKGLPSLSAIAAANYDGREYAQHTVATLAASLGSHLAPKIDRTISYTPINAFTVEIVQRQNGRIVARSVRTIASNGRTMTDRSDYIDEDQRRIANVLVFEKQ
jgi:hypothetical protein